MFALIGQQEITGATIITHGFTLTDDGGGYMLPLAQSIRNQIASQTGGNVWLLDYDLTTDGGTGVFNASSIVPPSGSSGQAGHLVLLYDWAPESNEDSRWWAETAGDSLFALGSGLGVFDPRRKQTATTQFIGHSFGTVTTTEAVERLAGYGVPVAQVTLLDPHDFDQDGVPSFPGTPNYDGLQQMFDLGAPDGYGATIWDNVASADVYYQTRGNQGFAASLGTEDPEGRPLSGAYNRHLDAGEELPAGNPYGFGTDSDHGYAWHTFYRATVTGSLPAGATPPAGAVDFSSTGWAYSVHNQNRVPMPAPNFYGSGQDHEHSESYVVLPGGSPNQTGLSQAGLTSQQIVAGRWAPEFQPGEIANGDFQGGERSDLIDDIVSGWSHHGGGGDSQIGVESGNLYLQLDSNDVSRRHNYTYIPINASRLTFDLRVSGASSDDRLEVTLGDSTVASLSLASTTGWAPIDVPVPLEYRDSVSDFEFRIGFGSNTSVSPTLHVDNVEFHMATPALVATLPSGATIDLGTVLVGASTTISDAVGFTNQGESDSILDIIDLVFTGEQSPAALWDAPGIDDLVGFFPGEPAYNVDFAFLGALVPGQYTTRVLVENNTSSTVFYDLAVSVVNPDFNSDGLVDAADYTLWRDSVGTPSLLADADGSGAVDQADYQIWRQYYGQVVSLANHFAPVPEPASLALVAVILPAAVTLRRRPD